MKLLEKAILEKGQVLPGEVLKVGSFLNNQVDVKFLNELAKDVKAHFNGKGVNKILTVEASGIPLATLVALNFNCDMVFAKKSKTSNVSGEVYTAECYSYTHKNTNTLIVPKDFLSRDDNILIIDDFLAKGGAVNALTKIIQDAGANLVGITCAIEKGFQGGGDNLRNKGVDVYSLAVIDKMGEDGSIVFRK